MNKRKASAKSKSYTRKEKYEARARVTMNSKKKGKTEVVEAGKATRSFSNDRRRERAVMKEKRVRGKRGENHSLHAEQSSFPDWGAGGKEGVKRAGKGEENERSKRNKLPRNRKPSGGSQARVRERGGTRVQGAGGAKKLLPISLSVLFSLSLFPSLYLCFVGVGARLGKGKRCPTETKFFPRE